MQTFSYLYLKSTTYYFKQLYQQSTSSRRQRQKIIIRTQYVVEVIEDCFEQKKIETKVKQNKTI